MFISSSFYEDQTKECTGINHVQQGEYMRAQTKRLFIKGQTGKNMCKWSQAVSTPQDSRDHREGAVTVIKQEQTENSDERLLLEEQ